jgi:DNA-binding NtrC family response regulator
MMADTHARLAPLIDLLRDAREGEPRWLSLRLEADEVNPVIRGAMTAAETAGFLPLTISDYARLRDLPSSGLDDRSLLLIARPGTAAPACRNALLDASARSSRPHVLLDISGAAARERAVFREARASYGAPAVLPEDLVPYVRRAERCDALVRQGCHAAAERLLREVLGALVRRRAWAAAAAIATSLGRLLLERGRASDAAAAFGDAAGHAGTAGAEDVAARAHAWQAAARVDAGLLVQAEAQCRAVLAASVPDAGARLHACTTLVRVLLWQSRADEAAECGLEDASGSRSDPYALSMLTRVALARADPFRAGGYARALLDTTHGNGDPVARVLALTTHLRLMASMGDLRLAEERLVEVRQAARQARTPLRLARARLVWADGLRQAGRRTELTRELERLRRLSAVAPPLLRSAIDRRIRGEAPLTLLTTRSDLSPARLLTMARDEEDDRGAVARLLGAGASALRCSRIDLHSCDAGPASVLLSAGTGPPSECGPRVLAAGIAIGPERGEHATEMAVPVRLGSTLLAALSARWLHDRRPGSNARELLDLLAAAAAPRVEAMLTTARAESRTSVLVPELVGGSAAMSELRKAIARAAGAPFAVLIQGESGVGKELVARAIHQLSPRRERRLCDINCAAIPDDLLESELFGHARGAFTGAVADRPGLFEDANGGTLFLDEVADLSARAQATLLRVLQQQEVRRVGETFSRPVDVRIIAAANRELREEAAAGRFRQDLLYRLDVIHLTIPPLRDRPDDIAPLAEHFWRSATARVGSRAQLSHGTLGALSRYQWPGNIRELQNVISALAVVAPSRGSVRGHLLPAVIAGAAAGRSARLIDARLDFERRFVNAALARAGGSRTRAARELGMSRQGLLKLLARVGVA